MHTRHMHTTVEDHYNSNVQLRRTARVDANVAIGMQKAEVDQFRAEEEVRRRELEEKFVVWSQFLSIAVCSLQN